MFSLEDRPTPPQTPVFSSEMADFLVTAARTNPNPLRRTSRARVGVAAGIAAVAIGIGSTVALSRSASRPLSASPVHVHLAAFSVDTNPGGTVTVSLSRNQIFDPHALRQALAQAGVPAVINVGTVCYNPHPERGAFAQVVALHQPGADGTSVMVITPSKMPAGSKLSIGYLHNASLDGVRFTLLTAGAPVTCSSNPLPPHGQPTPAPTSVPSPSA
jgi:hypothetical protein